MKVYLVKRARREWHCTQCHQPIAKGESFYTWQFKNSPPTCLHASHGYPRPSMLTSSDKLQRVYRQQEAVSDAMDEVNAAANEDELASAISTLKTALEEAAEEIRQVGEEYGESADNMEQAFPNGSSVIDEIREKSDTCSNWADNCEQAASEIEDDVPDCDTCGGEGTVDCDQCRGTGEQECEACAGTGFMDEADVPCDICNGTGKVQCDTCNGDSTVDCPDCEGTGKGIQAAIDACQAAVDDAMSETL